MVMRSNECNLSLQLLLCLYGLVAPGLAKSCHRYSRKVNFGLAKEVSSACF